MRLHHPRGSDEFAAKGDEPAFSKETVRDGGRLERGAVPRFSGELKERRG